MRLRPSLHDLYVGRMVLGTVLLTWAVLVGLDVIIALADQVGDVKGNYTFGHAVAYVMYTVPRRAYTMFPTAAVIGSLMGLGQLAASSELTALRALGLSRRRLSISVAATITLLTGLMVISGETIAPWGQRQADTMKIAARSGDAVAIDKFYGIWAREGDTFLYAQSGEDGSGAAGDSLLLKDVRLFEMAEDGRLASIARVKQAEHHSGYWLLKDVRRVVFNQRSVTETRLPEQRWNSKLDSSVLAAGMTKVRNLPTHELGQNIQYRKRNGLDAREYEDLYWSRWFYPLSVLALCLAAIPFAFGSLRSGGMGKRLFMGILFAVGFWALQLQFVRLAGAFHLDFRFAYAMPPIVLLAASMWFFRRRSN